MSSIETGMQYGIQSMNVHSLGMNITAHNVANVNTAGFKPQHPVYATGPDGWGVRVDAVLQDTTARGQQPDSVQSTAMINASSSVAPEIANPSGTDIAREMVNMVATQYGYEANAKLVRTADSMLGYLLDMKAWRFRYSGFPLFFYLE